VVPRVMERLKPMVRPKRLEKFLLSGLLVLALLLVPLCHFLGSSHLLGAFLSGLSFCTDHDVHKAWTRQVKRVLQWLLRIFFAATIAFEIPIEQFWNAEVIRGASVLCLAIVGKVLTGLWAMPLQWNQFLTVGIAMSAWGEFAFITATTARSQEIIDQTAFASVILAVVISVVVSPVMLRLVIQRANRSAVALIEGASARDRAKKNDARAEVAVHYCLRTSSSPTWGLNARLFEVLSSERLTILDFRSQHDEARHLVTNELYLCDPKVRAPATAELGTEAEARVQRRSGKLLGTLRQVFADGGTVSLERWLPGAELQAGGGVDMQAGIGFKGDGGTGTPSRSPHCVIGTTTTRAQRPPTQSSHPRGASSEYSQGGALDLLEPIDEEHSRVIVEEDDDETTFEHGYKAQRPTTLDGFVVEHRGTRRRQVGHLRACPVDAAAGVSTTALSSTTLPCGTFSIVPAAPKSGAAPSNEPRV